MSIARFAILALPAVTAHDGFPKGLAKVFKPKKRSHLEAGVLDTENVTEIEDMKHPPVVHIHIHKTAGSTMCELARVNGERTCTMGTCMYEDNCNHRLTNWAHMCQSIPDPQAIADDIKKRGLSYVQVERNLHPGELKTYRDNGFILGMNFRDPMHHLLSLMVFDGCSLSLGLHGIEKLQNGGNPCDGPSRKCYYGYFQSFFVRTLSGNFDQHRLTTDADLEMAKRELDHVELGQIVERFEYNSLSRVYKWDPQREIGNRKVGDHAAQERLLNDMKKSGAWEKFLKMNEHDIQLYRYAMHKYRLAAYETALDLYSLEWKKEKKEQKKVKEVTAAAANSVPIK